MRNTFVEAINKPITPLVARTQNGMRARATTSSACLDLFGSIGGMRGKDVVPNFEQAFNENPDLAIRIAQWARDVRGGAGERKLFRDIMLHLERVRPDILLDSHLLENVAEIGRFDDLLIFTNVRVREKAFRIIAQALVNRNGLAAKWMPRKGPVALELREFLGLRPKEYRKLLVSLTNVVETQMCARQWSEINFNHVPSVAMTRYMTAFHRNSPEIFQAWKNALKRNDGTAKVNASALYPYNVVRLLGGAKDLSSGYGYYGRSYSDNEVATAMWAALPNYMNDKNVLAVCDNSGSMSTKAGKDTEVTCADVAASLAMYTASKTKGAFANLSISFNDDAKLVKHDPNSLAASLKAVCSAAWGSTNLHSVFNLILTHALRNRVPAVDMPSMLLILSDMQFNTCVRHDDSALQMIRRKYEDAGYEMPQIVFWNLSEHGNKPVRFDDNGVAFVSGFSPSIMETILAADLEQFTPEAVMLKAVGKDRYNW